MPNDNVIRLKIYSEYFHEIRFGRKTFEVRKKFEGTEGDVILFEEIDKLTRKKTGATHRKIVGHVFEFPNWYIKSSERFKVISLV